MARKPFRVVTRDAPPALEVPPPSILEAAESGDRLEELRAMRRRLAHAMDNPNTAARDLAALSRRQIEIGKEIQDLEAAEDDLSVVAPLEVEAWDGTGY
ncbi:hypothetical protein [Nocardia sp. MW-W600-9]